MRNFLNYFGQFRLYSLLDLLLLLIAARINFVDSFGIVCLHLAFILFLEYRHLHSYRERIHGLPWIILTILGILFYRHLEIIPFILFSYLYTKKNQDYWSYFSPLFRGLQYLFLIGGVLGYDNPLTWISSILMFVRNFTGDMRDLTKDKNEGMKTLPVLLGLNKDYRYTHLVMLLATSSLWWGFTTLPLIYLITILVVEIGTYNLTPR